MTTPLCERTMRPANVLVVDDESHVRALLARWLRAAGYAVRVAASVQEASEIIEGCSIDVVTTDVGLPGESGIDWLPRLCAYHADMAVLMLTGCDDTRLAIQALTQGAWGYLIKPVAKEELLFQIGRALERRQFLIEQREHTRILERQVCEQKERLLALHEETVERLMAASLAHDDETGEHVRRIGVLSAVVAAEMRWDAADVELIRLAAPMHDIGKVGIPDAILRKPGPLTAEQFDVMKTHTVIGAKILAGSCLPMLQAAEKVARSHHERWDGNGYPDGLRRNEIPLTARIVAVVDAFDALTHDRVYRGALSEGEALARLDSGVGTHFDPEVVMAFFDALPQIRHALDNEASLVEGVRNRESVARVGVPRWCCVTEKDDEVEQRSQTVTWRRFGAT